MTRFKYYSNYLACLLGTLIAFELCWIGAKYVIEGEVVEAWLRSFRVGDVTDDDFRARLVDTFIARVELRNDEALIFYNIREKGPHSRVRVRPEWWSPRDGTRTPKIIVLRDYVVLRIAV